MKWNYLNMGKDLSEMTLEELWELFPIFLVEHDDRWEVYYDEIEKELTGLLSDQHVVRISHIGSTAVQEIWAKNIVDVMVEIPENNSMKDVARILEQNGFTIMSAEANRISLNKGYTENGFADKVYHIHLRYAGDNDELFFRDYLNDHTDVAKEYEALKLRLWKQYKHNRDAYTNAKTDFITKWTAEAKRNTETDTDKSKYIHSSHFHAEYPRGLVKRMILSTFAVENRENGRRLGN